ncbi:MAG: hypothetical protein H6672_14865 [Anaerolineaceae bacterium]|nr:hypothetical protein [Anaerolineaceae bacterium]
MSKYLMRTLILSCVLLLLFATSIGAQEETPAVEPTAVITDVPTAAPTTAPTDIPTEVPTVMPTAVPTDIPTEAPTEVVTELPPEQTAEVPTAIPTDLPPEETAEVTEVPTDAAPTETVPTAEPPTVPDTLPAEPPLSLLVRELLDNGDLSPWRFTTGWGPVPSEGGLALQVINSNEPLLLQKGVFANLAVQARFQLHAGDAQISVRQSDAGNYTAALNATGLVTLYRGGTPLQTAQVTLDPALPWHTLRLSAINAVLRVAVDGMEIVALSDRAPLPPGEVALSAHFTLPEDGSVPPENVLLADDLFLWVPTAELGLYPQPTPVVQPTTVPTQEPTIEPTLLPLPTSEPTAEATLPPVEAVTEEPTLAPVEETTEEPTLPPVETPPPSRSTEPTAVGKDTSLFAPPSAEDLAAAAVPVNDDFANAISVGVLPFTDSEDTTAATLEVGEPSPTCGLNSSFTIWYDFTPSASVSYLFTTAGSDFDTIIGVYTGASVGALTQVGCNDDASTTTFTSQVTLALNAGTTYHIQVGGYNGRYGNAIFTAQQVGLPLPSGRPVITAPTNNYPTNNASNPLPDLMWTTVPNATHYEVLIADSSRFTNVVQTDANIPGTSYTVNPDLPGTTGTTYYWKVRGLNINDQPGPWSAVQRFVVDTVAPDAPILSAPADGAIVSNTRQAFTWRSVRSANGYLFDLDDDAGFGSPLYDNYAVTSGRFTPPAAIPQAMYYWRSQATDAAGNVGVESVVRTVTFNITTAPRDGSAIFTSGTTANVALRWARVIGATSYTLYLYDDATCTTPHAGYPLAMGVLLTKTEALGQGNYCWRVEAVGIDAAEPLVSSTFDVSPPALLPPVLVSPPNSSYTNDTTPTLDWDAVTGAAEYEVQWATNSRFTTDFGSATVTDPTTEYTLPTLPDTPGTRYYWRVATINSLGVVGRWSRVFNFTLDTTEQDAPVLSSPADGATVSNTRQPFTWRSVRGANGYLFDLDDDAGFGTPLYNNEPVTAARFTPPAAIPQALYYWRVQSKDAAGNAGPESVVRTVTFNITTAPRDGLAIFTSGSTANVALRWARVVGATSYTLYLYDDATCTSAHIGYPLDMGVLLTKTETLGQGNYCWRVEAVGVDASEPSVASTFDVSSPALVAPVLMSPANNAFTNDTTPTLDWDAVAGATGYEVQWATNSRFTTDFGSATVTDPTTDYTLPTLPDTPGTRYYWRVGAINNLDVVGRWSRTWYFTLDTTEQDAPVLASPADGAIVSNTRQPFTWRSVRGANGYFFDLDDDAGFGSPLYDNFAVTSTRFIPPTSIPQALYYWRVQSKDAAGNAGPESVVRTVTFNITTLPRDGSAIFTSGTTANVALRWARVIGATSYTVYLYDDDTCTTPHTGYPLDMGTLLTKTQTLDQGVYCWRVKAVGVDAGEPPVASIFTVSSPALLPPTLVSPANNAFINDTTPTLDWDAVINAAEYEVQWATNSRFTTDFGSTTVTDPTTEYTLPTLPDTPGTRYYWRVATINSLGVVGRWSRVFFFTLDTVPPDVPTQRAPSDQSVTTTNPPTFTWLRAAGAFSYEIALDTSTPTVPTDTARGTSYRPPSPLLYTTYYWMVRSVDRAGNVSDWSNAGDPWEVKINSRNLVAPVLNRYATGNPSPMDLPPTVCWSPISWAEGYEVVVDNNTNFSSPVYTNAGIAAGTQCVTIDPLPDGTYYWRVRAVRTGPAATWSSVGTFTVES